MAKKKSAKKKVQKKHSRLPSGKTKDSKVKKLIKLAKSRKIKKSKKTSKKKKL
jgi:hypothetical protein